MDFNSLFKTNSNSLARKALKNKTSSTEKNAYKFPETPKQTIKDYRVLTTHEELFGYLNRCKETGYCSFDWETSPSQEEFERWELEHAELQQQRGKIQDNITLWEDNGTSAQIKAAKKMLTEHDKLIQERKTYHRYSPLDPHRANICTVSLSAAPNEAAVLFLWHEKGTKHYLPQESRKTALNTFLEDFEQEILMNSDIVKIAYNLNFETKMAMKYGIYIGKPVADPFVMIVRTLQVVRPNDIEDPKLPAKGKGLKQMTLKYLDVKMNEFEKVVEDSGHEFFNQLSTDDQTAMIYSAEDADYALQLYLYFKEIAEQVKINRNKLPKRGPSAIYMEIDGKEIELEPVLEYDKPYGNYSEWLHEIEMPFARVIGQMEYHGFTWNMEKAKEVRETAEQAMRNAIQDIKDIGNEVYEELQQSLSPEALMGLESIKDLDPGKTGKNTAVRFLLFDVLGCPTPNISEKTNKPNMDHNSILDMKFMVNNNLTTIDDEEFIDIDIPLLGSLTPEQVRAKEIKAAKPYKYKEHILKLLNAIENVQKFGTLLSSHIYGREKYVNPITGRIHASFSPWTETSRLNSSRPNGQNVPRPDTDEFGIRNVYQAAPGKVLLLIDYSGFELRLMAWASGDKTMLEIFNTNGDMHAKTASTLTGKDQKDITKEERTNAKSGNFGISYGGTAWALQRTYKKFGSRKSLEFCEKVVTAVKNTYPGLVEWQKECTKKAKKLGYAETIFGYRRMLPYINSMNRQFRSADERRASNTPIQGSAADIMKRVQNAIYDKIAEDTWKNRYDRVFRFFLHGKVDQIQQFHDELVLEVDNNTELIQEVVEWVVREMEKSPIPQFPLKLIAEPEIALKGWGGKQDYYEWLEEQNENS